MLLDDIERSNNTAVLLEAGYLDAGAICDNLRNAWMVTPSVLETSFEDLKKD